MRLASALLAVGLFALAGASCKSTAPAPTGADAGGCTSPEFAGAPLGVRCNALVDAQGRTVLLHGVNARVAGLFDITFDDGRLPLQVVSPFTADDAARMRALGFNALRLPLNWSAIEPTETGGFNETYLDKIAEVVGFCRAANVLVLLDLHQDAYSKEIGEDGAPLWAIVPPPTMKLGGPLMGLQGYVVSQQVQSAYATFFGPSADGVRLRDRYTKMAARVLARFANDPSVIGLELMNEPFATDPQLHAFYRQMSTDLRVVAPKKLFFFEPPAIRNVFDKASIGDGAIAAGTVYAPHVYTLVFAGSDASRDMATKETLAPSNQSARDEADGFLAPLAITEYGYGPDKNFARYIRWQSELQDEQRASSFFWLWKEADSGRWGFYDMDPGGQVGTERPAIVQAFARVRLEAVAGRLVSVGYDTDAKTFETTFIGDAATTGPNLVSLGATSFAGIEARCDGNVVPTDGKEPLAIPCAGPGTHTLRLTAK